MNILVIEDDEEIRELLATVLIKEGFSVRFAHNGLAGIKAFQEAAPEVLILDWMLPGLDGLEVCQRIRATPQGNAPYILMLTARDQEVDKIIGLSTGVDDYMVKPFSPRELVARIRALLRRSQRQGGKFQGLQSSHFTVDMESRTAHCGDQPLDLTTLEFNLLATFLGQLNRVWTREQLISRLWGDDFFGDERVVDTHVARLRKKIEENPAQPRYLQTVTGVGYKFVDGKHEDLMDQNT
ncbi:response regulator transcription factor [Anthocerotibacter panamensis]|uniref:response regulator transcription factor n=1 Tax=Anthocerotibacter panamensis TaxID=2857077 RepID=UPI001C40352F|nr:response regulator transcription factor [Anthocerotibacter panamensis]